MILFLSSSQPANFHRLSCFRFQCSSPKDTRTSSSSKASHTSTAARKTSFRSFCKSTRHSGWAPRAKQSKHTRSSRGLIGGLWKHFSSSRRFCQASGQLSPFAQSPLSSSPFHLCLYLAFALPCSSPSDTKYFDEEYEFSGLDQEAYQNYNQNTNRNPFKGF